MSLLSGNLGTDFFSINQGPNPRGVFRGGGRGAPLSEQGKEKRGRKKNISYVDMMVNEYPPPSSLYSCIPFSPFFSFQIEDFETAVTRFRLLSF